MKKQGIVLELTALLDVILIMLFLVMQSASDAAQNAQTAAQEALAAAETMRAETAAAQVEVQQARDALAAFEIVADNAEVIKVQVTGSAGRHCIRVSTENIGGTETLIEEITSDISDQVYVTNALTSAINAAQEYEEAEFTVIVFSYDSRKIYKYEYDIIDRVTAKAALARNVYTVQYNINAKEQS